MRCRKLPAASSSQCLWITDEVLSEAFNRFLRVSHAQQYHTKRYRSNVPGPLEARRRATRRKMGMAAVGSGSGPAPFDMGALFGLGVKPGADMEKGMKWEKPQSGSKTNDSHWDLEHWRRSRQKRIEEARLGQFLEIPEDPVVKSKDGFEALLATHPATTELNEARFQPLLDYLQSSENEPDAHLTVRLIGWLYEQPTSAKNIPAIVAITKRKLALGTISESEVEAILEKLRKHESTDEHFVAIAECLPRKWARKILVAMTRRVIMVSTGHEQSEKARNWLTCLRACTSVKDFSRASEDGWAAVYAEIAINYRPSHFAEHFAELTRMDAAMAILRHWVPRDVQDVDNSGPFLMDARSRRTLRFRPTKEILPEYEALMARLQDLRAQSKSSPGIARQNALGDMVQALAEHRLPYANVVEDILSIEHQRLTAAGLRNTFMDLIRRRSVDVPTSVAVEVVQTLLGSGDLEYALQIFERVPTIPLSECFELPLQLIEKRKMHGERTFGMLNRRTASDTIAPDQRTTPFLSLNQEHVDVVHLVAYAYAKSPHIPSRVAFRRVWECYRFLADRQASLDPLLSRAMVKAGISRPLAEGKRPSASQTAYILRIVQQLEGADMAMRLDRMIWEIGKNVARQQVMRHGSRWNAAQAKRDETDRLMVNAVRWRSKGWTIGKFKSTSSRKANAGTLREPQASMPAATAGGASDADESVDMPTTDHLHSTLYAPLDMGHGQHLDKDPSVLLDGKLLAFSAAPVLQQKHDNVSSLNDKANHASTSLTAEAEDVDFPSLDTTEDGSHTDKPAHFVPQQHERQAPGDHEDHASGTSVAAQSVPLQASKDEAKSVDPTLESHENETEHSLEMDVVLDHFDVVAREHESPLSEERSNGSEEPNIAAEALLDVSSQPASPPNTLIRYWPERPQGPSALRKSRPPQNDRESMRQQFQKDERKARIRNAEGWAKFAAEFKKKRIETGYDSWSKETKGRK